jgi:hypothetical protein
MVRTAVAQSTNAMSAYSAASENRRRCAALTSLRPSAGPRRHLFRKRLSNRILVIGVQY